MPEGLAGPIIGLHVLATGSSISSLATDWESSRTRSGCYEQGWTFADLGANQDSYAEGGRVGFSAANVQNFKGDARGSREVLANLSRSVSQRRSKMRSGESFDQTDLFEGDQSAEADLKKRS